VGVQESTGTDIATSGAVSAKSTPAAAATTALPLEAAVEEAAPVPTPVTSPLAPVEEPEPGKVTSPTETPTETAALAKPEDIQPKQEAASIKIEAVKEEPASETTEEAVPALVAEVKTELLPSTAASIEHVKNEEPEAPPPERVIEVPEPEKVEVKTPRRGELLVLVALLWNRYVCGSSGNGFPESVNVSESCCLWFKSSAIE
jgi:hypothetical protein